MKRFIFLIIEVLIFISLIFYYSTHSVLLAEPSKTYSTIIAYRLQTNALLQGHLALSQNPFGAPRYDYLWTGHGLQQNWGLGVPFMRFPFEWVGKHLGFSPFPDRVILLFYLTLMVVFLNMALRLSLRSLGIAINSILGFFIRWYLIVWVLFSPGFSSLIHVNLDIYHEAIFYACIYSHLLLALFLIYVLRSTEGNFFVVCIASGLAWLIRPTLISYGLVTLIFTILYAYQNKYKTRILLMGILSFSIGIFLDLIFNYFRFGSIFEFGYSGLIGPNPRVNYSSEFDYPFHYEPFFNAAKELIGRMFFQNLWQSHTYRDRVFEFNVFNVSHLIVLGIGLVLILVIIKLKHQFKKINNLSLKGILCLLLWGFINFCFIFMFYLRNPWLNSRYLCDFSTAFDAITIGVVLFGSSYIDFNNRWKRSAKVFLVLFLLVAIFLSYLNCAEFFKFNYRLYKKTHSMFITNKETIQKSVNEFNATSLLKPNIPEILYSGHQYAIPIRDGYEGWNITVDCLVSVDTTFFLPTKECFIVNYTIDNQQALPPIKVKKDLEFLKLVYTQINDKDLKIQNKEIIIQVFSSNKGATNPVSFYNIAWVTPNELNYQTLPIKLNWVRVSEDPHV